MPILRSILTYSAIFFAVSFPAGAASFTLNLQPVTVCEAIDPATCQSTLDTVPGAALFDEDFLRTIYGQIGIDVNVLPSVETTSLTLSRDSLNHVDPGRSLQAFRTHQELIGQAPNTVYVGFTNTIADGRLGTAFLNAQTPYALARNKIGLDLFNGGAPLSSANIFAVPFSMRFQSVLVAHLIGRVLGASADDTSGFIMSPFVASSPPGTVPPFSAASAEKIRQSILLKPIDDDDQTPVSQVPLPVPLAMLLAALSSFMMPALRRRIRERSQA